MSLATQQDIPAKTVTVVIADAQAEAIAQRLAQYQRTMELIASMPQRQNNGSPTAQEYRVMAYEDGVR